jgi:hypothetical protein
MKAKGKIKATGQMKANYPTKVVVDNSQRRAIFCQGSRRSAEKCTIELFFQKTQMATELQELLTNCLWS